MSIKRGGTVPREHEYTGKNVAPQDPPSTPSVEAGTTESRPGELVEHLPFTEPSSWAEDLLCVQEPFMTIRVRLSRTIYTLISHDRDRIWVTP